MHASGQQQQMPIGVGDVLGVADAVLRLVLECKRRLQLISDLRGDKAGLTGLLEQVQKVVAACRGVNVDVDALRKLEDAMQALDNNLKVAQAHQTSWGKLAFFFKADGMLSELKECSERVFKQLALLNVVLGVQGLQLARQLHIQTVQAMQEQFASMRRAIKGAFEEQRKHMRADVEDVLYRTLQPYMPADVAILARDPQEVNQLIKVAKEDREQDKCLLEVAWTLQQSLVMDVQQSGAGAAASSSSSSSSSSSWEGARSSWQAGGRPLEELVLQLDSPQNQADAAHELGRRACSNAANQVNIAGAGAVVNLVGLLRSSSTETQRWAAYALSQLACNNADNQASIAAANAIPPLVELLGSPFLEVQRWSVQALGNLAFESPANQRSVAREPNAVTRLVGLLGASWIELRGWAAWTLGTLAAGNADNQASIAAAGAVGKLVGLLGSPSTEVQRWAARALGHLSSGNAGNCGGVSIAAAGAVAPLVRLLAVSSPPRVQRWAAYALSQLACDNQARIADAGAVAPLVALLGSPSEQVQHWAACTLSQLAHNGTTIPAGGTVEALVRMLGSLSEHVRVTAARTLLELCDDSKYNKGYAAGAGAVVPLLRVVKEDMQLGFFDMTATRVKGWEKYKP